MRVDTFGTGKVGEAKLTELVRKNFSLTPKGIIESLNLRRPIYQKTAAYGHFGRNEPEFTWEATDKAASPRRAGRRCGRREVKQVASQDHGILERGSHFLFREPSSLRIPRNS